jgi:hypothetical protein
VSLRACEYYVISALLFAKTPPRDRMMRKKELVCAAKKPLAKNQAQKNPKKNIRRNTPISQRTFGENYNGIRTRNARAHQPTR